MQIIKTGIMQHHEMVCNHARFLLHLYGVIFSKMQSLGANDIIATFNLQPHPEGGWYKETYRSNEAISHEALPKRFSGERSHCTAIYFLLEKGNFSAFHRIKSDECWHFYAGGPLVVYIINAAGGLQQVLLGNDILSGQVFQFVVPAGVWFASAPAAGTKYSLVGCTVAPGFDFDDFELANRHTLITQYPQHADVIKSLTRA